MNSNLDEIKRLPIREVAARLGIKILRGNKAMCFRGHDKRTPSLSFAPAKNFWKCFGCDLGGDTISLVMSFRECDFNTAMEWFGTEFRINLGNGRRRQGSEPRSHAAKRNHVAAKPPYKEEAQSPFSPDPELYTWLLGKCGGVSERVGLKYLAEHGIPLEFATEFGVRELRSPGRALKRLIEQWGPGRVYRSGLAWGNQGNPQSLIWSSYALLFSFFLNGEVGYVQGRLFEGEPKYLNPRGVPKPLFNIDSMRSLPRGELVHLCEGVPNALALEAQGFHAFGVLGASSFRPEWVDYFLHYDVVLLPDGDRGGESFRSSISRFFMARGKAIRCVDLPAGKDVADVIASIRGAK